MQSNEFSPEKLAVLAQADVALALAEDVGEGDLTAALVDPARRARARVLARESAVVCGAPWVQAAVAALDPTAQITWHVPEGQRCAPHQGGLEIGGHAQALLVSSATAPVQPWDAVICTEAALARWTVAK